jgi:thiosulfate/3-mercaptopyruvate sulfurtransferase
MEMLKHLIVALVAISAGILSVAATASPLATIDDVKAALERGAVIWDVRSAQEYQRGHIPGAVNIGDPTKVLRDENTEDFIATSRIAELFGQAGIDPLRETIVYGKRGANQAYFGRYTIQYFGGRDARVYHDGIDGWTEAAQTVRTGDHKRPPLRASLAPRAEIVATTEEVISAVRAPRNVQVLDVRTRKEFEGDDIRAIRGGHIPTAINIPYEANWKDPQAMQKLARKETRDTSGMSLKDRGGLANLYSKLDPEKETIVYCQSGQRAAVTAAILEDLGFRRVKVYDASWLGYAAKLDAPAENEKFVNIGLLKSQIRALEERLEEVERQSKETRPAETSRDGGQ